MYDHKTHLPGGVVVSTVEMPTIPGFELPYRFETMVFWGDSYIDRDCDRYATLEEAELGHSAMVTKWTGYTPEIDKEEEDQ